VYRFLHQLAGANRYLWNAALARIEADYKETGESKTSFFDLGNWYKNHKNESAHWLSDYPVALTRAGLKDLSHAYKQFFKQPDRGHPKFKKKGKAKKTFAVDVSGARRVTGNGYFRLKRGMYAKMLRHNRLNRYSNPVPKSARIFEQHGNWYITIVYEVDAVEDQCDSKGIGVDRNVGQVADSTGHIHHLTNVENKERRIKNLQRWQARQKKGSYNYRKAKKAIARHKRKIANILKNDLRHIANLLTDYSTLVLLEDLKTKGMTSSAKGTVEAPGRNVRQKAGLNRSILGAGWNTLESYLSERGFVHMINPAYTSQTCSKCGHVSPGNRISQAVFRCQQCEYLTNADMNAARNIWASGMASMREQNGCGVYVRPVVSDQRQRALKHQKEAVNYAI
jgi:putative transposase